MLVCAMSMMALSQYWQSQVLCLMWLLRIRTSHVLIWLRKPHKQWTAIAIEPRHRFVCGVVRVGGIVLCQRWCFRYFSVTLLWVLHIDWVYRTKFALCLITRNFYIKLWPLGHQLQAPAWHRDAKVLWHLVHVLCQMRHLMCSYLSNTGVQVVEEDVSPVLCARLASE